MQEWKFGVFVFSRNKFITCCMKERCFSPFSKSKPCQAKHLGGREAAHPWTPGCRWRRSKQLQDGTSRGGCHTSLCLMLTCTDVSSCAKGHDSPAGISPANKAPSRAQRPRLHRRDAALPCSKGNSHPSQGKWFLSVIRSLFLAAALPNSVLPASCVPHWDMPFLALRAERSITFSQNCPGASPKQTWRAASSG